MTTHFYPNIDRIKLSLFLLRLGVSFVLVMWSLDKILNSDRVKDFYPTWSLNTSFLLGSLELLLVLGFFLGLYKNYSYSIVLIIHTISTLLPWQHYFHPFESKINLLYFTSWPMLAACIVLFLLRHEDTFCNYKKLTTES